MKILKGHLDLLALKDVAAFYLGSSGRGGKGSEAIVGDVKKPVRSFPENWLFSSLSVRAGGLLRTGPPKLKLLRGDKVPQGMPSH